jgi:hypothetical protein
METRICNATTLLTLCRQAEKHDFNRQAATELLWTTIDADGVNMVEVMLPYHRASFGPSKEPRWPDHHRCRVYCKVTGKETPEVFFLDVAVSDFENMMPESVFLSLMEDARSNPQGADIA